MAGSYPDVPGRRIAYDADGTIVVYSNTMPNDQSGNTNPPSVSEMSTVNKEGINDEDVTSIITTALSNQSLWFGFVFPEKHNIDGIHFNGYLVGNTGSWIYSSVDTTNSIDGAWTVATDTDAFWDSTALDYYRQTGKIQSLVETGKTGLMVYANTVNETFNSTCRALHVYGGISAAQTPDRLLFLDPENSDAEFSRVLDYGDVPRGQTSTRTVKLKNNSSSLTLNTVQITAEDLYLNAGSWYTFSKTETGTYSATLTTIGNMSPGGTQLVYVKQIIPDAETLGVQAARMKAWHASTS